MNQSYIFFHAIFSYTFIFVEWKQFVQQFLHGFLRSVLLFSQFPYFKLDLLADAILTFLTLLNFPNLLISEKGISLFCLHIFIVIIFHSHLLKGSFQLLPIYCWSKWFSEKIWKVKYSKLYICNEKFDFSKWPLILDFCRPNCERGRTMTTDWLLF